MNDTINFKGKEYPVRTLIAVKDFEEVEVKVAQQNLLDEITKEPFWWNDPEAWATDEQIIYYCSEEEWGKSDNELAEILNNFDTKDE